MTSTTAEHARARRNLHRLRTLDLLSALVPLSTAIILALFLADGGAHYFTTWPTALTGVGIVTGLAGTNLLLVMVILAARVPLIDQVFGHDRALTVHNKLGKPVYYLLVAHAVFLITGYAAADQTSILGETANMLGIPDILLAFISLALMTAAILGSITAARRHLPYPVWYVIHLITYAAILTAIPHQFSTNALLAPGTFAYGYWIALYLAALAALLTYRIALPLYRNARHQLRITAVTPLPGNAITITMTGKNLNKLPARGGHWANWRFWAPGLWWDSHPYSLSAHPDGHTLQITVRNLGDSSRLLQHVPVGTRVTFEGPYGTFTEQARTRNHVTLIGAGIGITPIKAILEDPAITAGTATVLLRAPQPDHAYLLNELTPTAAAKNAPVTVLTGHRPQGVQTWLPADTWHAGTHLQDLAPHLLDSDVYICGPTAWTDLVKADALRAGVPADRIHAEAFTW